MSSNSNNNDFDNNSNKLDNDSLVDNNTVLPQINEDNIIYIKRNHNKNSIKQQIISLTNNINIYNISKNYQTEGLLYKICYDRVYRPGVYDLISSVKESNMNIARNYFQIRQDNYQFTNVDNNSSIIEKKNLVNENNYVCNIIKYNKYLSFTNFNYPTIMVLGAIAKYRFPDNDKVRNRLFLGMLVALGLNFAISSYLTNKKADLHKDINYKTLKQRYEIDFKNYRDFLYDD